EKEMVLKILEDPNVELPEQFKNVKYKAFVKEFIAFANRLEIKCFYYLSSRELERLEPLFTILSEAIVKDDLSSAERFKQWHKLEYEGVERVDIIVSDRIPPRNFNFVHHSIFSWLNRLNSEFMLKSHPGQSSLRAN